MPDSYGPSLARSGALGPGAADMKTEPPANSATRTSNSTIGRYCSTASMLATCAEQPVGPASSGSAPVSRSCPHLAARPSGARCGAGRAGLAGSTARQPRHPPVGAHRPTTVALTPCRPGTGRRHRSADLPSERSMTNAATGSSPAGAPLRRPGRGRRPVGRGLRLLAGQRRPRRGAGGAQALPPGEDLRRRPHPPVGAPARGHGPGRGAGRRRPPLPGPALARLRPHPRAGLARSHPDLPGYGYVITRKDLDALVAERAAKAGATVWEGTEAVEPVVEAGLVRGARSGPSPAPRRPTGDGGRRPPAEVRARYTVVADGANSRFGRSLGTSRNRAYPLGMAIRGYWTSPRHDEPWIDSWLDIRDKAGNVLPGYGWIFPVGDGRINVGIGLLSTFNQWKAVNTTHLLQASPSMPRRPGTSARRRACGPATGGRLPMGLSVGPRVGPTWLVDRRRRRHHQPLQRRGHRLRLRDGPLRRRRRAPGPDQRRRPGPADLRASGWKPTYALYYKVARAFVRIIGRPELMKVLVTTGMRSRQPHGVGAAHHGQPAPPRRAGPGRGGLPGRWPPWPAWCPKRPGDRLGATLRQIAARSARRRWPPLAKASTVRVQVGVAVGQAREKDLVGARRDGHAPLQQAVHQAAGSARWPPTGAPS